MKHTTIAQKAWAAGFFDGEGAVMVKWVEIQAGRGLRLSIAVAQNTLPSLELFKRWYGGSIYEGARCHQWKAHGAEAAACLKTITPYLIVKKVKADEALKQWRIYLAERAERPARKAGGGSQPSV